MNTFLNRLADERLLVADGATGTNLQAMGLPPGVHTEDWLIEHPERILALEKAFVDAGADLILTCTFGGSRLRMKGSRHEAQVRLINQTAASLAREATASRPSVLVGGSMGPLGQLLTPLGPITFQEATSAYAEQAQALSEGGVDFLVLETHFAMDEAKAALEAVRSVTELPVVVSFSYDRGTRTMMGVKPEAAAVTFKELGTEMIGVNCGTTLENALAVLAQYAAASSGLPIWAKPNAGLPRMDGANTVYDVTPADMAGFALAAIGLGARVIGGCCGSTPAHVRAVAEVVRRERQRGRATEPSKG